MLDKKLYGPIMVSYLQYRLLDNFEDEAEGISFSTKKELMDTVVRAFDPENEDPRPDIEKIEEKAHVIKDPDYRELTEKAGLLRRAADRLGTEVQRISFRGIKEMNAGMKKYLGRQVDSFEDLDEYCYYVAGTVGRFLTDTLVLKADMDDRPASVLRDNFRDAGLFLQKVNIVRDIKKDLETRRKNFWPLKDLNVSEDQLMDERYRGEAMYALSRMLEDTERHINGLVRYMQTLPEKYPGYRRFFAVNNALGLATMERLSDNPEVFYGDKVKVSKRTFSRILNSPEEVFKEKAELYLD